MKNFSLLILLFFSLNGPFSDSFAQGTWTQKANFGGGGTSEATAFSIGSKGYVGGTTAELWEYDQILDSWTQMATFTGGIRSSATAFAIGTKGYLGTGGSYNDFYEWDQTTNTWTQKANFGGSGREGAIGFSTSTKGYIGMGGNYLADLWEYDPLLNAWTQMASCPGPGRYHAAAFAIADKGYVCGGFNGNFLSDFWEFDPPSNTWSQLASMPATARDRAEGWAIGTKGYIAAGWSGSSALNDFYEWDQPTNSWVVMPVFPGAARYNAIGMAIGGKGYIGTGIGSGASQDFWEFGSNCSMQATATSSTCFSSCDGTATLTLPDPGAVVTYSWNTNPVQTTQTATGLCPGSHIVTMTDTTGCSNSISTTVTSPSAITATAVSTSPSCFGFNDGSLCITASGGSGVFTAYSWSNGQTTVCATGISGGTYTVTITDSSGCTDSANFVLSQPAPLIATLSHTNASCPTCPDGNATANITGGNGPYVFSWSNGVTNSAYITNLLPGIYTCCITDANGCSVCDSTMVGSPSSVTMPGQDIGTILSPNPAGDFILLSNHAFNGELISYILTDLSGKICRSGTGKPNDRFFISLDGLENGMYLLVLEGQNYWQQRMLVKNKTSQ